MSEIICDLCSGYGYMLVQEADYITVDMAIDAGDKTLAGQPIYYQREIPCPNCFGIGTIFVIDNPESEVKQ